MHSLAARSSPLEAPSRRRMARLQAVPRALWLVGRRISQIAIVVAVELVLFATVPGLIGFHNVTITGGSMGSALPVGSVAVTRTVAFRDVRVGDIIAFTHPGGSVAVVHRVVEIRESGTGRSAITRGDANADNDPEALALDQGRGDRVVYDVPYVGYAFVFVRTPGGLVVLTVLAMCSLLLRRSKHSHGTKAHATSSMAA